MGLRAVGEVAEAAALGWCAVRIAMALGGGGNVGRASALGLSSRLRRLLPRPRRAWPLIGFALTLASQPAFAQRSPASLERPWSRTGGLPPPRPPVPARARAGGGEPPGVQISAGAEISSFARRGPTPARVHDRRPRVEGGQARLLFPSDRGDGRSRSRRSRTAGRDRDRSGSGGGQDRLGGGPVGDDRVGGGPVGDDRVGDGRARCGGPYRVEPGDSLWDIASEALGTRDGARIDGYWPRIHDANQPPIGRFPDLILPGWALELPPECA